MGGAGGGVLGEGGGGGPVGEAGVRGGGGLGGGSAIGAMAGGRAQGAGRVLGGVGGWGGSLAETMARSPRDWRWVMRSARSSPAFSVPRRWLATWASDTTWTGISSGLAGEGG